jgi:uncharacterized protein (TIGR02118 family)
MVKLVAFFKRKAGLTPEQFHQHWRTTHADLVVEQKGMRRYVQNHTLLSSYSRGEPDYDGVAEAWFDNTQAMRELAPSPAYAAVRADEANFIDAASMGVVLTTEVVIVDGAVPASAVKWIGFIKKSPDVSVDFFQEYWSGTHGPIGARIPGIRRYVQCCARKGIYATGRTPDFDGIPMSWFDDLDAVRNSGRGPEYEATRADERNFMAAGPIPSVVALEHEIPL